MKEALVVAAVIGAYLLGYWHSWNDKKQKYRQLSEDVEKYKKDSEFWQQQYNHIINNK